MELLGSYFGKVARWTEKAQVCGMSAWLQTIALPQTSIRTSVGFRVCLLCIKDSTMVSDLSDRGCGPTMVAVRKTMFPVDFSVSSVAMSPYVQRAARLFGAAFSLVHAVDPATFDKLDRFFLRRAQLRREP